MSPLHVQACRGSVHAVDPHNNVLSLEIEKRGVSSVGAVPHLQGVTVYCRQPVLLHVVWAISPVSGQTSAYGT